MKHRHKPKPPPAASRTLFNTHFSHAVSCQSPRGAPHKGTISPQTTSFTTHAYLFKRFTLLRLPYTSPLLPNLMRITHARPLNPAALLGLYLFEFEFIWCFKFYIRAIQKYLALFYIACWVSSKHSRHIRRISSSCVCKHPFSFLSNLTFDF